MDDKAAKLIEDLCDDMVTTGEAVGPMGDMLGIPKPSDPDSTPWRIEVVSFPDDARPIGRRIAQLLKHAKRTLGLKVIRVTSGDGADAGTAAPNAAVGPKRTV
jgi:hypothetical protein